MADSVADDLTDLMDVPASQELDYLGQISEFEHDGHPTFVVDGKLRCVLPQGHNHRGTEVLELPGDMVVVESVLNHSQRESSRSCNEDCAQTDTSNHHKHSDSCGHVRVQHGDHFDYLVDGVLHHPQPGSDQQHCHDHGNRHGLRKRRVNVDIVELSAVELSRSVGSPRSTTSTLSMTSAAVARMGSRRHEMPVTALPALSVRASWFKDKDSRRFATMLFLTGGFFFVELIYGTIIGSLALVADSMHMLSDIIALCVGFYAQHVSDKNRTNEATFGFTRMEVVGALMNGTFLLALCFSIIIEAVHRIIEVLQDDVDSELKENALDLLMVGGIGLAVNVLGLFIFGGHGHSHGGGGGHGHSHGGQAKPKEDKGHGHSHDANKSHDHGHSSAPSGGEGHDNMNIRGVFLHVLGDALGSVAVMISALVIYYSSSNLALLSDPLCSLVIAAIICMGTIPLVKQSSNVLLQKVPSNLSLERIELSLRRVAGVQDVHEFHLWSLNTNKIVASAHVLLDAKIVRTNQDLVKAIDSLKAVLHQWGIHSTSIQPEFVNVGHQDGSALDGEQAPLLDLTGHDLCTDRVCETESCRKNACCPPRLVALQEA